MIRWLNQGHDFWDQTLLKELLKDLPEVERQVVIVPGTMNNPADVNETLSQYSKVLVIVTSDEENKFNISQLAHPDMITYVQYPDLSKHSGVNRFLPLGPPPDASMIRPLKKDLDWFFSGQINHDSRRQLIDIVRRMENGKLLGTDGFSQGFEHQEYYDYMSRAKVAPCPGGPFSADSFRTYEALEAGTVPVPDKPEFWNMLWPDHPFRR